MYDNLTLPMQAPLFPGEIALSIHITTGIILCAVSLFMFFKNRKTTLQNLMTNMSFFNNFGILLLGLAISTGSLIKEWRIYYTGAIISAFFLGYGMLIDVKDLKFKIDKLILFLKESFLQNISYSTVSNEEITETLKLLNKNSLPDTFITYQIKSLHQPGTPLNLKTSETLNRIIKSCFEEKLGSENFLIIPLSHEWTGLAISLKNGFQNKLENLFELLEKIHIKLCSNPLCHITVGIGRSYEKIENLKHSYIESLNALTYANNTGKNNIIHINNIQSSVQQKCAYPYQEKKELLTDIRLGNKINIGEKFELFFEKILICTQNNPTKLHLLLLEFYGSLLNTAIEIIGNFDNPPELDYTIFSNNHIFQNIDNIKKSFFKMIMNIITIIASSHENQIMVITKMAKKYINEHYQSPLSVEEVAKNIYISPSYFLQIFKKQCNCTFIEYLTKIRLDKAKNLLLNSNLNITEIAFAVGFKDSNYFSTVFKNNVSMPPSEFRRKNK